MPSESFDNSQHKINKNWENTDKNLSDESKLSTQNFLDLQNNLNPKIAVLSLISKQEIIHTFPDESVFLLMIPNLQQYTISNMNDSLIPFTQVTRKFYRDDLLEGEIASEEFLKIENYTSNNVWWKYINDNTMLLQIYFPLASFNNTTYMDVDLIIINPNIYTAIPKFKYEI